MSQQEMNYAGSHNTGSESSYAGYDGVTPHDTPQQQQQQQAFSGFYGQKLSEPASRIASAGQRLALAIVSISLLTVMTLVLIIIGIASNASNGAAFALVFFLVLFYVAVIIINVLFNRRH